VRFPIQSFPLVARDSISKACHQSCVSAYSRNAGKRRTLSFNLGIKQATAKHAIAHNKIMVIDGQVVITRSFNFTKFAEEINAENLLVIRSPELANKYADNWQVHANHSDPYAGRTF
jgi:phosphatidylserine/phosphatidylglycerophosphate/cardiolipin synthase-like enzyme